MGQGKFFPHGFLFVLTNKSITLSPRTLPYRTDSKRIVVSDHTENAHLLHLLIVLCTSHSTCFVSNTLSLPRVLKISCTASGSNHPFFCFMSVRNK